MLYHYLKAEMIDSACVETITIRAKENHRKEVEYTITFFRRTGGQVDWNFGSDEEQAYKAWEGIQKQSEGEGLNDLLQELRYISDAIEKFNPPLH